MQSKNQVIRTLMAVTLIAALTMIATGCMQSTSSTCAQTAPIIKAEGPPTTVSLGMR